MDEAMKAQCENLKTGFNGLAIFVKKEEMDDVNLLELMKGIIQKGIQLEEENTLLVPFVESESPRIRSLRRILPLQKVVSFGIAPGSLGLNSNQVLFNPMHVKGMDFLYAPSLSQLNDSKELKMNLWAAIKKMFEFNK